MTDAEAMPVWIYLALGFGITLIIVTALFAAFS